jgi:putative lipoic acid-binding regulatory protein
MSQKNDAEFYANLEQKLAKTSNWPAAYLYKFIVPTSDAKIKKLVEIFDNLGAVIKTKKSSKGKFTSVSIHLEMNNPKHVITKYKEVGEKIEGVISL